MAVIMKGSDIANSMRATIEADVSTLINKGINPALAVVRIGDKQDAISYENSTVKWMKKLNIECHTFHFDNDVTKEVLIEEIKRIDSLEHIHGILLLRPTPAHIKIKDIENAISPGKDIDGMNPANFGKLCSGDTNAYAPCTAEAVVKILDFHNIDIVGKNAVMVGASMVVGKPAAMLMINKGATVTVCHDKTVNLPGICRNADILVVAIGSAGFITEEYIKEGAVVIDVGINVLETGKVVGDINFEQAKEKASYITPVPAGVGSVTNAVLAEHIVRAAKLAN